MNMHETRSLEVERVRHPLKFRTLRVLRTQSLAPNFLSVVFTGDDLDDFVSASFDDHIKLFFPEPGQDQAALANSAVGSTPSGIRRDFTPRRFDRANRELEIQFALHGTGPASEWTSRAKKGDMLGIGGPRGSRVIPVDFDWFLMVGDATAFPAMGRRLDELPAGKNITVIAAANGPDERIELAGENANGSNGAGNPNFRIIWVDLQTDPKALEHAVAEFNVPAGEGYVWAAGEAAAMRAIHADLAGSRGVPKARIRAAAYWKKGTADVHEDIGD
jgi:NADPH-dependent ferric siderophore reductase